MDTAYMELRSVETTKKMNWMLTYSKDPELAELLTNIIDLDPEATRVVKRILRTTIESMHLYALSTSHTTPISPPTVFDKEVEEFLSPKSNTPKVAGSFKF